jgi:hypothetical protein
MEGTNEIIKEIAADGTPIPECSNICAFGCGCDCDCGKCGQALCIANSVCDSNINEVASSSVSVPIPANSCITKIYASLPNAPSSVKYILIEVTVGPNNIFCHALPNLGSEDPVFDTTLVQPLCVGNTGATAKVTALDNGDDPQNANLTLTVVYCPNCC